MEASQAGTAPAAAEGGGEQAAQTGGQDLGPIVERFNQFASDFGERFDRLESTVGDDGLGGQDPGAGQGGLDQPEVFTDGQGNFFDAFGSPVDPRSFQQEQGIDQVRDEMRKEYDQKLEKALNPILEHFKGQQLAELEDQYPEFRDRESADRIVEAADELAAQLGHPELAENPGFLKVMLLAQKAQEAAKSEVPAGAEENEVQPESASGSNPGAAQLDDGDRIVAASRRGSGFFS